MSDLDIKGFVERQVEAIRDVMGGERALIAVSGGVDSTVSAVLTHMAIGDNLICVFIDDNFMRLGEPERVKSMLSSPPLNLPVKILDEKKRFMEALSGLTDAEEKRKAFREAFYQTLSDAAKAEGCKLLVQGTIKADIEETKGGIKTQHNILEQIGINPVQRFGYKIVEPIASIYKYQVRAVARYLGAPSEASERQPFPGPGLSVRVVGEVTSDKLDQLKYATVVVENEFEREKPAQYFAVIMSGGTREAPESMRSIVAKASGKDASKIRTGLLSEKTTGMIEGKRVYGLIATIEIEDDEGDPMDLGYETLAKMQSKIQSKMPSVSRVLYLVARKEDGGYTVSMRAVETQDFLTAEISRIPWSTLVVSATRILRECPKVARVYYDITPKPPATVEFE